jgi:hypothetical protein
MYQVYERRQRTLAGQLPLTEEEVPTPLQLNRRRRASRLGESLYCIGDCHKMLSLDCFPDNHVGVCKACAPEQLSHRQSSVHNSNAGDLSMDEHQPIQFPPRLKQSAKDSSLHQRTTKSSIPRRQQHRHATLPSSVTAYSDAGEYPSGRSTYGVSKPIRRKSNKTQAPWISNTQRLATLRTPEIAVATQLTELEGLLHMLTSEEILDLRQRKADQAGTEHTNTTLAPPSQTVGSISLEYSIPSYLTSSIRRCLCLICEAWAVDDVKDIFPDRIWPKSGTLWNLPVLELFHTLTRQYPLLHHRNGISDKFAELTIKRRQKRNAKTQWTIQDAKETQAWAKSTYGSPPPERQEPDVDENCTSGVRSSQRPRIPSRKAAALSPVLSTDDTQLQSPSLESDLSDMDAAEFDNAEGNGESYGKVPSYGIEIGSSSSGNESDKSED